MVPKGWRGQVWRGVSVAGAMLDSWYSAVVSLTGHSAARFFLQGWGTEAEIEACEACEERWDDILFQRQQMPDIHPEVVKAAVQVWSLPLLILRWLAWLGCRHRLVQGANTTTAAVVVSEYEFTSPAAEWLPHSAKQAHFQLVQPANGAPVNGVVVHLAATGDELYSWRRLLVADWLAAHGYASILLMIPLYGVRRDRGQVHSYPRTVFGYLGASAASMMEGAALATWARSTFRVPVALTGVSYGGSMASCAAMAVDGPLAVISCVGAASPEVLVSGSLSSRVAWESLHRHGEHDVPATQARLAQIMAARSAQRWLDAPEFREASASRQAHGARFGHCIVAAHDKFVSVVSAVGLYTDMKSMFSGDQNSIEWVPGGHATTILAAPLTFVPGLLQSLEQLLRNAEAAGQKDEPSGLE